MSTGNYLVQDKSPAHNDDIWCLKYTTSGVLSGSADGSLKLWDPSNPQEAICTMIPAAKKGKNPLAMVGLDVQHRTTQPEFAISCTLDSVVSRFSLRQASLGVEEASWTPPFPGTGAHGRAWCIAVHPDPGSSTFATSGLGGHIKMLNSEIETFGEEKMRIPSRGEFAQCTFSPDGRLLASTTSEGQIALCDSETGQLIQYWTAHAGNVRSITFSPDSSLVVTGGDDKQINVFDIRGIRTSKELQENGGTSSIRSKYSSGGQQVANLAGHTGWVLSLACRKDGKMFASASSDGTIKLWDLARPSSSCIGTLKDHEADVWAVDWAPISSSSASTVEGISGSLIGGNNLISGGKDGMIRWWRGAG